MAYQNLLAGRIYLNVAEFLALKGVIQIDNLFRTLPVKLQELPQPLSLPSMGNYNLFKIWRTFQRKFGASWCLMS